MGSVTGDEVTSDLSSPGERIFVSVRVRPLNDKEVTRNEIVDWECINDNSVIYKNNDGPDRSMYPTSYTFDRVFGCHSSTRQVYEEGAKAVALSVVGGINSSIFAYGQTSSGKTYTMGGITEYTLADIFEYIRKHNERNFILKFSALEIYNESVRDFLSSDPTPLRLLDDPERGTVVEKLTEEVVRDWNHLKLLLSICEAQRQVGETNLNESSSRSHQIIRLTIESTTKEMSGSLKSSILSATVNFVDLAGSERASQALSAGSRLKEGSHINRSLLTLGTVIRKLSKGRNGHIPYRDSKLTRILQSSLGGNARTAIICTMSPARSYVEQSRNTLLFATCAKEVTTHARVNLVISDKALVKQLQRELARLENELRNVGKYGSYETSILLRDKDVQIEKLERQVRELTMERDRALSRIHDLQQEDEAENNPTVWEASPLYSKFKIHAHSSWETQTSSSSTVADPQFSDAGSRTREFPQFTLRHCRTNSEANSLHSDIRLDLLPGIVTEPLSSDTSSYASPTPLRETHNLVISGNQDHVSTESGDKVDGGAGEDFCRDVQCIESQESAATSYDGISSSFYVKEPGEDLPPLLIPRSKEPIVEEPTSSSLTQDRELDSDRYYKGVALQISETSSSWQEVPDANNDESLADTGTSEAAAVVNGVLPSVQTNKDEDDDDIKHEQNTQAGSGIDFTVKLQDIQRKLSELKGDGDSGKFSRKSSITSFHREAQATDANDVAERSTPSAEVKELHEIYKEEVTDTLEEEEEDVVLLKVENPPKSVKDVGLDPQDDLDMADGAQCPHTNFKTIQQEVISLWDVCNVSLTYRTYFFLLYKNDPADSIYMEVELRRLRFIRDALSRGNETPLHGQTITPLSLSEKSLRRERQMLGKLLKKRISREDRESLFLRWGIRSESKRRCSQLVQRIWSSTEEMDHIAASSELVAKLVKFSDKQVRKELFGLNLMSIPKDTGRSSRSYSCRWSPMPHR